MVKIPEKIKDLQKKLEQADFEAFFVGGCVRDMLMGVEPKDWDITTNAAPDEVLKIFSEGKYENTFGTVLVPIKNEAGETQTVVEITTYRSEQGYSDRRHPDEVKFEKDLDKDLSRRDFTVNALAMRGKDSAVPLKDDLQTHVFEFDGYTVVDLFGGRKDIKQKIIRSVGEPAERFKEDALRMIRAIRFACQLNFDIEDKTERAIGKMASSIRFIANERIKDELIKILTSDKAYDGIMLLYRNKLMQYILPELLLGDGMAQDRHHLYSVFKHNTLSLKNCPSPDWRVRFAALMHDVGKPPTMKKRDGVATFYNHEHVSAKLVRKIMKRLKFSSQDIEKVVTLVRNHMFYYNVGEVTDSSVRRLIRKVGKENLRDLIDLRIADRLGSGVPKGEPYKLRHLQYVMEKVQNDPVSVKMLKIDGNDLMEELGLEPGPKIGAILDVLLSEVIEDPKLNEREHLLKRARELKDNNLAQLREQARDVIEEKQEEEDRKIRRQYKVK